LIATSIRYQNEDTVQIGNHLVGDPACHGEIGINHNGSVEIAKAHRHNDVGGCDTVKFKHALDVVYPDELESHAKPVRHYNGDLKRGLGLVKRVQRDYSLPREKHSVVRVLLDEGSVIHGAFNLPFLIASASLTDDNLLYWRYGG
jgi:sialic acid synthase SpsE